MGSVFRCILYQVSLRVVSLVPLLFILHTADLLLILENQLAAYADYSTLMRIPECLSNPEAVT